VTGSGLACVPLWSLGWWKSCTTRPNRVALWLACWMALTSALGGLLSVSSHGADQTQKFSLQEIVPRQFGDWREQIAGQANLINPQTQQLISTLYSQTLSRVYANSRGQQVMLSLAYGGDQRGELRAHKPEVCYPAQGFELRSNQPAIIATPYGVLNGRRLETRQRQRNEPVTYWFTLGNQVVSSKLEQRWVEMRLGLTGEIPDGLLFRVSSIDADTRRAYAVHENFIAELLAAVSPEGRQRLIGHGLAQGPENQ
jgi:EpsI family protein